MSIEINSQKEREFCETIKPREFFKKFMEEKLDSGITHLNSAVKFLPNRHK